MVEILKVLTKKITEKKHYKWPTVIATYCDLIKAHVPFSNSVLYQLVYSTGQPSAHFQVFFNIFIVTVG